MEKPESTVRASAQILGWGTAVSILTKPLALATELLSGVLALVLVLRSATVQQGHQPR